MPSNYGFCDALRHYVKYLGVTDAPDLLFKQNHIKRRLVEEAGAKEDDAVGSEIMKRTGIVVCVNEVYAPALTSPLPLLM